MLTFNPYQKITPFRSKEYREFIRTVPPIVQGHGDVVPHHEGYYQGSTGSKASDIFTVSLPESLHTRSNDSIHALGWKEFERVHNVDLMWHCLRNIEAFLSHGGILKGR